MSKKRDKTKYPGLKQDVNLKSRRYFIDNNTYMHKLSKEEKQWLNDFNQAYYGNDRQLKYKNFDILEKKITDEEYKDFKKELSDLRKERRELWNKSADNMTEEERSYIHMLTEQIEELSEFLYRVVFTRKMAKDNDDRKEDFLTMTHANNAFELISWEDLRDKEISEVIDEAIFSPIDWEEE